MLTDAVAALNTVSKQLYVWDSEPDTHGMKRAQNYAINVDIQGVVGNPPSHSSELDGMTPDHIC
jgi:hypothetical protein